MHVKKSTKVGLSGGGGEGGIHLDFLLKEVAYHEYCCDKNIVLACVS